MESGYLGTGILQCLGPVSDNPTRTYTTPTDKEKKKNTTLHTERKALYEKKQKRPSPLSSPGSPTQSHHISRNVTGPPSYSKPSPIQERLPFDTIVVFQTSPMCHV